MTVTRMEKHQSGNTDACIWMKAGVVRKKRCKSDYDCVACRFDRALQRIALENAKSRSEGIFPAGKRGQIVFWKEPLMELPQSKRPCIHHMKGRIGFRACTNEYRCDNCEFDQYFYDEYTVHAIVKPVDVLDVEGFKIPQGYYLHPGHAWLKLEEGGEARIGLDDFALRLMGPQDRIEAPLVGKEIRQNRADIKLNRNRNVAGVLSPINGVVTAVNAALRNQGDIASRGPYTEGWILKVHTGSLRQDVKRLMIGTETGEFIKDEVNRLYEVIEEKAGPLAADGGQLGHDIFGNLPQLGWDQLAGMFLRS